MWRVLVVDDNEDNRALILAILSEKAQCETAACGREAWEAFQKSFREKKPYDVILLDVAMPDMDGLELLQKIRDFEKAHDILLGKGIPIIMVTAHSTSFMKSFNRGCDDFIMKPIDADELLKKIESKIGAA